MIIDSINIHNLKGNLSSIKQSLKIANEIDDIQLKSEFIKVALESIELIQNELLRIKDE